MATRVELRGVAIIGPNPTAFDDPILLRVTLEVMEKPPICPIDVRFTWKPIWDFPVDQELDELEVGPLETLGKHVLTLQCDPPDYSKIPDPTGPTALVISFLYQDREFLHLGYNVLVVCEGEIPEVFTDAKQLRRNLTRCFPKQSTIRWDSEESGGSPANVSDEDANKSSGEDAGDVPVIASPEKAAGEELGLAMLMVIGPDDSLLFDCGKSLEGDEAHLSRQFMLYASLDMLDDAVWTTRDFFLPAIDRPSDGKFCVSAYVGFAPVKLLLMQEREPGKDTRLFLSEAYELCVKYLLNPFSTPNAPIRSAFGMKLRRLYDHHALGR